MENKKNPAIQSEAEQQAQEQKTRETIDAQEQVELLIFPDGNPAPLKVTINGVDYRYPKGQKVQVPAAVAEVINHRHSRPLKNGNSRSARRRTGSTGRTRTISARTRPGRPST